MWAGAFKNAGKLFFCTDSPYKKTSFTRVTRITAQNVQNVDLASTPFLWPSSLVFEMAAQQVQHDDDGMMKVGVVLTAAFFAAEKHKFQTRKGDGSAYIVHPLGVAKSLYEAGVRDVDVLVGAVLHDAVEDTDCTFEEIEERFGGKVRKIVEEVSDDKNLGKGERKRMQVQHAPFASHEAKLVKLSDKLYNLRDISRCPPRGWGTERIQGYFVWSKAVVNGIRGTNQSLEDALDEVFSSHILIPDTGMVVPAIPPGDFDAHLTKYFESMDVSYD